MLKVVTNSKVPDYDYLEPPSHVITDADKMDWLQIMFESQSPFIHMPKCSPSIIQQLAQTQWAKLYLVYGSTITQNEGAREYWMIKTTDTLSERAF